MSDVSEHAEVILWAAKTVPSLQAQLVRTDTAAMSAALYRAANEIERLRAEVERLEKGIDLIANTYGRYPAWYTQTAHNVLKGIEESDDE